MPVELHGSGEVYRIESKGGKLQIGRDKKQCEVALPATTRGVSRVHAVVEWTASGEVIVRDCSTYGTIVDAKTPLVGAHCVVKNGAEVVVGEIKFIVKIVGEETPSSSSHNRSKRIADSFLSSSSTIKKSKLTNKETSQTKVSDFFGRKKPTTEPVVALDEDDIIVEETPQTIQRNRPVRGVDSVVPNSQPQPSKSRIVASKRSAVVENVDENNDVLVEDTPEHILNRRPPRPPSNESIVKDSCASHPAQQGENTLRVVDEPWSPLALDPPAEHVGDNGAQEHAVTEAKPIVKAVVVETKPLVKAVSTQKRLFGKKRQVGTAGASTTRRVVVDDDDEDGNFVAPRPISKTSVSSNEVKPRAVTSPVEEKVAPAVNDDFEMEIVADAAPKRMASMTGVTSQMPFAPPIAQSTQIPASQKRLFGRKKTGNSGADLTTSRIVDSGGVQDAVAAKRPRPAPVVEDGLPSSAGWSTVRPSEATPQLPRRGRKPKGQSDAPHSETFALESQRPVTESYANREELSRMIGMVWSGVKYEDDEENVKPDKKAIDHELMRVVKRLEKMVGFVDLERKPTQAENTARPNETTARNCTTVNSTMNTTGGANFKRFRKAGQGRFNSTLAVEQQPLQSQFTNLVDFRQLKR